MFVVISGEAFALLGFRTDGLRTCIVGSGKFSLSQCCLQYCFM